MPGSGALFLRQAPWPLEDMVTAPAPLERQEPPRPHVVPPQAPEAEPALGPRAGWRRRLIVAAALIIVVALAAFAIWRLFLAAPPLPPGVIAVSGRIEGDDSAISPKTGGRLRE